MTMQTHRFIHRRPTASETGQTNATRLMAIAKHLEDREAAGKIMKRVKCGLHAIARGHERDFVEAGYGDQWHGLYRFGLQGHDGRMDQQRGIEGVGHQAGVGSLEIRVQTRMAGGEMKQPIAWHVRCVLNRERTLEELSAQHLEYLRRITSLERDVAWERTRIAEARRRGIGAYDPERFMVRNGNRVEPKARKA